MALADQAGAELKNAEQFFNRSTSALSEEHSGVKPAPGMMTAAQQVAHAAQTIDWFIEGAFRPEGFDTDFAAHAKALEDFTSLTAARAWFEKAVAAARATMSTKSDAELMAPIAAGPIMGGLGEVYQATDTKLNRQVALNKDGVTPSLQAWRSPGDARP